MLFYVLECSVSNCIAEFYLNDIPIIRRGPDIGDAFGGPINYYMVDGINHLEILINPGPVPAEAITGENCRRQRSIPPTDAFARAALATYPQGAIVEGPDREEIISVEWQAQEGRSAVFPKVCSVSVDLGEVYGRWKWQDAPRLTLDEATIREVTDFVIGVHSSLAIADFERYVELSGSRNQEGDLAYGKAEGETARQIINMREFCFDNPSWGMELLKPSDFSFRLCGNDRMVESIAKNWKAVLEELPDKEDGVVRYPMMISKIDGQWRIVR